MLILKGDSDVEGYKPQVRARPPIFLVHGDQDELIPIDALFHAKAVIFSPAGSAPPVPP